MPDDILKWLRFWSDDIGALIPSAQVATVKEAADEIERLRSVLEAARGRCHYLIEQNTTDDFAGALLGAGVNSILRALDGEP